METPQEILQLIARDSWRMAALRNVAKLNLPDWWIGAGFVRNCIWDHLHQYTERTPLNDLDVIYFADDAATFKEDEIQLKLEKNAPEYPWEVTNQATVHISNQQQPYINSIDALSRWTETATCIAVSLAPNSMTKLSTGKRNFLSSIELDGWHLNLAAPYGIEDLLKLVVRPTPHPESKRDVFERRVATRDWFKKWPKLKIVRE